MECKAIQDLILTDYQDGQLAEKEDLEIKDHLAVCALCREFTTEAQKITRAPFEHAKKLAPPPELWEAIRNTIEQREGPDPAPLPNIFDRLRAHLLRPMPALAFASIISVLLVATILVNNSGRHITPVPFNPEAQLDYMAYLLEDDETDNSSLTGDFGTPIEEYFL